MRRLTKEEFIERSISKHGDLYSYELVEYVNNSTDVAIICPIHGAFLQKPHNHMEGNGCRKCSDAKNEQCRPRSFEDFVKCANAIHGNKYEYKSIGYKNSQSLISIKCPIHGWFKQRVSYHIDNCGCQKCGIESISKHKDSNSRLYKIFNAMKSRCFNENNHKYKDYGGRGITVCGEWMDYSKFKIWADNNGYSNELTIDRIDNNGNYEPNNCKWTTRKEQSRNTRTTAYVEILGYRYKRIELEDYLGLKREVLRYRLKKYGESGILGTGSKSHKDISNALNNYPSYFYKESLPFSEQLILTTKQ